VGNSQSIASRIGQQSVGRMDYSAIDEKFMRVAIELARRALAIPGAGEVGCVIVKNGEVVADGFNESELTIDPTAHAEIVAIRKAARKWNDINLCRATLYCTLQPCGMCSMACIWANIGRIVYGASRKDVNSIYFELRHFNTADLICDAFRNDLEVISGVLADQCSKLYVKPHEAVPPNKLEGDTVH